MGFRMVCAAIGIAALAACEPTPSNNVSVAAPAGATAQQALEGFSRTVGIAEFLAIACARQGIKRGYSNSNTLTENYVMTLVRQGYSAQELNRAAGRINQKRITESAISYLMSKGARRGDMNSVCQVGRNEIAQGTAVGKLLRRG